MDEEVKTKLANSSFSLRKYGFKGTLFAVAFVLLVVCGYYYIQAKNSIVQPTPSEVNSQAKKESSISAGIKVAVYNGTAINGLERELEKLLLQTSSVRYEVTQATFASRNNYTESVVVDLTGAYPTAVQQLANMSKGRVGVLPEGEVKPLDVDILVILGKSYTK